jgi:hypothetical protein
MNIIMMIEAKEVISLAKQGIQEADEAIQLCSMELDQPLPLDEADEIVADMMVLVDHRNTCKKALAAARAFIKKNKFILN